MGKTIRIIKNGKPEWHSGKDIKITLDSAVIVDGVEIKYDSDTTPNFSRGGKCN